MLRTFTWCVDAGASRSTEFAVNTIQFGDGYEQTSSIGINNTRTSWQVTKTGRVEELDAIYKFLVDHQGLTPFYLKLRGKTKAYKTVGAIDEPHLGADVWRISFNLKEHFGV